MNGKQIILYNDYIRDCEYEVADRNIDGFQDFITNYHDYDVIHLFDKKLNQFKEEKLYMPMTFGFVDSIKKVYRGYRNAQYNEEYDYSILYKYKGLNAYFYFKLIYKTPDNYAERKYTNKILLYQFKEGRNNDSLIFIKQIQTKNPVKFDYKKYWKANYKQLLIAAESSCENPAR